MQKQQDGHPLEACYQWGVWSPSKDLVRQNLIVIEISKGSASASSNCLASTDGIVGGLAGYRCSMCHSTLLAVLQAMEGSVDFIPIAVVSTGGLGWVKGMEDVICVFNWAVDFQERK